MADEEAVWPPPPKELPSKAANPPPPGAIVCPSCGRRLLTQASVLCNWCGAVIDNEEYQQKAAEARLAQDSLLRDRLELEISETAKHGVLGRLKQKKKELKSNHDRSADMLIAQALDVGESDKKGK